MGYTYEAGKNGRLCCDACGEAGGVRKSKCPFGYCPAPALCAACRKTRADSLSRAAHIKMGCERNHLAYEAREKAKKDAMAEGKMLRCAARGFFRDGPRKDWTHVLFEGVSRETGARVTQGFIMAPGVYEAVDYDVLATPETYMAVGTCEPGPSDFYAPGGAGTED